MNGAELECLGIGNPRSNEFDVGIRETGFEDIKMGFPLIRTLFINHSLELQAIQYHYQLGNLSRRYDGRLRSAKKSISDLRA